MGKISSSEQQRQAEKKQIKLKILLDAQIPFVVLVGERMFTINFNFKGSLKEPYDDNHQRKVRANVICKKKKIWKDLICNYW